VKRADFIMNLNQSQAKKNRRFLHPSFSASIEPMNLINSFTGSMLLLLLPINESGRAPTLSTAEYHFLQHV
jgi:hypothetical protein